jgi:hypothetical protein
VGVPVHACVNNILHIFIFCGKKKDLLFYLCSFFWQSFSTAEKKRKFALGESEKAKKETFV